MVNVVFVAPFPLETTLRFARAVALVRPEHAASRRVLEKVGMREERRLIAKGVEVALYAIAAPA